jgi:CHC2 zinc finger/Domain of unknown function (DUF927)
MPLDIDRLLDELDLVDLARQAGAKLTQSGQQWRGPCPLHKGDNPTGFAILPGRNDPGRLRWWCHTCGAGDALHFIERLHNLEFIDAAKWAADHLRIPLADLGLTPQAAQEHTERQARRDVLDLAARFYQRQFRLHPLAIEYACRRKFTPRTMVRFGFSDGRGGWLQAWLDARNADLALARKVGLLRLDGRDFTANHNGDKASPAGWLIYIHWNGGRVDYLSARAIDPIDPSDKSRNLPGRRQVYRAEVRADRNVVLVEGQADAETLRQLGVSAWALCGAALDDADVRTLARRRAVYLALDDDTHRQGDEAETEDRAKETAKHAAKIADRLGPLTMIAPELPSSVKDCNQWLQDNDQLNGRGVRAWLEASEPWLDTRIDLARFAGPIDQAEHIGGIAHLLARLPQAVQAKWYKRAGKVLDMTPSELKSANGRAPGGDYMAAEVKDGCLGLYGVPLVNAALVISHQQTVNDGTNPPQVRYTVSGRLANGQPLRELSVLASEFEGLAWMSEWGARVIKLCSRGNAWQIARAIQEISVHGSVALIEENVYAHTGWATVNGKRSYLTAAGRLTADGLDTDTKIDLGESNMRHALPAPPVGEALRRAVRASLDFLTVGPRQVSALLWSAMYAAPLTAVRSLDTMLWVYGSSGSGKSTISHLALAHFGSSFIAGRKYVPQIGWNATPFAVETAMFVSKDAPLVIDDYAPQFMSMGERDKLRKTANESIRSLGNRLARAKGSWRNGDGSIRALHNPRGLVVSTAENPIEGQSLVNRMLYVPIEKGQVLRKEGNPILDAAQEHASSGRYAEAMSAFICWLITNWEKAGQEFTTQVDATARQARALLPSGFDRLPDYAGILDAAQALALRAFVDLGIITRDVSEMEEENNHAAILEVVTKQAGRVAEQSPAQMFLRAIESLLDRRKVYLAPRKSADFVPPDRADRVGWYDPADLGAVWLDTQDALSWAKSYWRDGDINFDTTRDALNRMMLQSDVLREIDTKRDTPEVSKWMGGSTKRALEIDVDKVLAAWQIDLRYPRGAHELDEPEPETGFVGELL